MPDNSNTDTFRIGDIISKIIDPNDENNQYIILELREEEGGNWHDGYSKSLIATLLPYNNNQMDIPLENEEYMIAYHCLGSRPIYYAKIKQP
jgi:hypothetical protein